jgi:hypothetical protein
MKIETYFRVQELVDKATYDQHGDGAIQLFPAEALRMLFVFRRMIDRPVTINNWHIGGRFNLSGFRPEGCMIGAKFSQHKRAMAFDVKVKNLTPRDGMLFVRQNATVLYEAGLRRVEDIRFTPTWFHIDCKPHEEKCIQVVDTQKIVERIAI